MLSRALFLDRDGTICRAMPRGEYLLRADQFELIPEIVPLIRTARSLGFKVVVVTNQGQVSKKLLSLGELLNIHGVMESTLNSSGISLDAIYACPHHDHDACDCRKPKPGLLIRAAHELALDLGRSIIVGDSDRDVNAGTAAGCKTVFLRSEHNARELPLCNPDFVVSSLLEVESLLRV